MLSNSIRMAILRRVTAGFPKATSSRPVIACSPYLFPRSGSAVPADAGTPSSRKAALGYVRSASGDGVAIQRQINTIQMIAQREGFNLLAIYQDFQAGGGRHTNPPGMNALLVAMSSENLGVVITEGRDRISRDHVALQDFCDRATRCDVELYFAEERIDRT